VKDIKNNKGDVKVE